MGVHELTEEERAQMMEQALKKMKIRRIPLIHHLMCKRSIVKRAN